MNKLYLFLLLPSCLAFSSCGALYNSFMQDKTPRIESTEVTKIYTGDTGLIYFSDKYPGKIIGDELSGVIQVPFEVFASDSVLCRVRGFKERPLYVYSNGSKFDVFRNNGKDLVYTSTFVRIPVSDISYIELKKEQRSNAVLSGLVVSFSALTVYIISNISIQAGDNF